MKKILLALVVLLAFAVPASAWDLKEYNINSTAVSGSQAVTVSTQVCVVAVNLACGGACSVDVYKYLRVRTDTAYSAAPHYAQWALGAAGTLNVDYSQVNGCGGTPGLGMKGMYPFSTTVSTTRGSIWYYTK